MKHAEKDPTEIVSFVVEAMLEPRLIAWYQAGQARIDALTLNQYLEELSKLVLEKNWAHKIQDTIISSKQGDRPFIDWKIELKNLNAILTTSSPTHALSENALKVQLEANLNTELKTNLLNCHVTFSPCFTPVFCCSDQSRPFPLSSAYSRSGPQHLWT